MNRNGLWIFDPKYLWAGRIIYGAIGLFGALIFLGTSGNLTASLKTLAVVIGLIAAFLIMYEIRRRRFRRGL
jgi:hypothetical protein